MAKDFSAKQIRTSNIIASGNVSGVSGKKIGLMIYSASSTNNYEGGFTKDAQMVSAVGTDVFVFVSGSRDSKITKAGTGNGETGVTLFGGDVVVSGTFYAERMIAEVDEVT